MEKHLVEEGFRQLMIKDVWEELQMVKFLAKTPGREIHLE